MQTRQNPKPRPCSNILYLAETWKDGAAERPLWLEEGPRRPSPRRRGQVGELPAAPWRAALPTAAPSARTLPDVRRDPSLNQREWRYLQFPFREADVRGATLGDFPVVLANRLEDSHVVLADRLEGI